MKTSKKWFAASLVSLSASLVFMDNTIVTVILSQLQQAFHANIDAINWVSSAYFLAEAAVIPIVGYLSDRFGSKVVFLTSLALFTIASLLCSLSPTKEALITFRVLQGIGGGALVPMVYGINYRLFPPSERAKVAGLLSIPILLAPALGPTIGGYLSTAFGWNAAFLINVPIGIVILFLAFRLLPGRTSDGSGYTSQSPQTKGSRKNFDFLGLLLSVVGVTTLVYGISQIGSNNWSDAIVLVPLLIGTAVLIAFIVVELRESDPVLDLRLFKDYTFAISNVLMWLIMGVSTGALFLLPLFFESVRGDTALSAGEFLIGSGLAVGVGLSISGLLYKRLGPRILTVSGVLLQIVGTYALTQINANTTGLDLQVWLFLRGLGLGLVFQPTQTLALSVVSNKGMARASSLVNVARQVTTATAVAVLTTYLIQQTATHATEISNALQAGLQTHNLTGVAAACAQTAGLTQNQAALEACVRQHALVTGIADTFWLVLVLGAICLPLALVMGRDPAIVAYKQKLAQAQVSNAEVSTPVASSPVATGSQIMGIPHLISTLTASGEEVMGPEVLLWHYPEDKVVNGSLLIVENNHFGILKSYGTILKVYEAGQHFVQNEHPLFSTMQLAFSGEPIPWQYEVLYINRAKLLVKASGITLSREMAEVDYRVDYYIHVATQEDAIQLAQHMPYRGHTLNIQDINAYAEPVIEEAVSRLLLITSLEQAQGLQMVQALSQLVHQRLQPFLSNYGITLDMVKVQALSPRDERMKELIALKVFGLSNQDAVCHYAAMTRNSMDLRIREQHKELEQNLYMIWQKTLDRYIDEIVALRTEFERTRANIGLLMGAQSAHLQQLSLAISNDLQASNPSLYITPLSNE